MVVFADHSTRAALRACRFALGSMLRPIAFGIRRAAPVTPETYPPDVKGHSCSVLDVAHAKKPDIIGLLCRYWIYLNVELVAMGGLEPPTSAL